METAQSGNILSPFHKYPFIIGNVRIPLFFKFIQNPNKFTMSSQKEFNTTKTVGGYVFEHWGKQPTHLHCEVLIKKDSSLSNFLGLNTQKTNFGLEDPMYSPELMTLQTLFNIDQRKIKGTKSSNVTSMLATYATAGTGIIKNPITTVNSGVNLLLTLTKDKKAKVQYKEPEPASLEGYIDTLTDSIILYKGVIYSGFFTKFSYDEDGEKPYTNKVTFDFTITNTTNDWIDTNLTQTSFGRGIAQIFGAATSMVTIGSMLDDLFKHSGSDTNGHI